MLQIYSQKPLIFYKGWLKWNATTAKDGIEVKTGNSKVNAAGHYLVLLGITQYCWAKVSTARQKLVLPGYLLLLGYRRSIKQKLRV
ncbi:hypothetical protein Tco_0187216 [Tanacetum coccineum]